MFDIIEVLLRIPPVFICDSLLTVNGSVLWNWLPHGPSFSALFFHSAFSNIGFFGSWAVFLLGVSQLLNFYRFFISLLVLAVSGYGNTYMLGYMATMDNTPFSLILLKDKIFLINLSLQICFALAFEHLRNTSMKLYHGPRYTMKKVLLSFFLFGSNVSFILPSFGAIMCLAPQLFLANAALIVLTVPLLEMVLALLIEFSNIADYFTQAVAGARAHYINNGLNFIIETEWNRLSVPNVFRIFWCIRMSFRALLSLTERMILDLAADAEASLMVSWATIKDLSTDLLAQSCENILSLFGMSCIMNYFTNFFGMIIMFYIGSSSDDDRHMGLVTSVLFFVLALQTGLTSLDPGKRLIRLYRNMCLLVTAILHFTHTMAHPLLMSLGAQQRRLFYHLRVLSVCIFLVFFPICFLYYLWATNDMGTWLLAVTVFCVEIVIKVIVSLAVYTLFVIDSFRSTFWERLDDYVYYIKATGNTIEFLFGIFLFCNGGYILMFEQTGWIRAIMMCVHAYCNIFLQAKEGWLAFMRRRSAVGKINSMRLATMEQLEQHGDVCSICYHNMTSGRITHCNHFFHAACLRKWLYIQDACPMCHATLYPQPSSNSETNTRHNEDNHPEIFLPHAD